LTGAAVLATYDPSDPSSRGSAAVAAMIGSLVNMRFGRQDELESDRLGVRFTGESGYDPRSMTALMKVLAESSEGARPPEFFSTHPNPENRIQRIEEAIRQQYPNGVPQGLES
ncbi:MAG TPA: M48 family metalloprotease, partial [Gemmatimonadales bacterium]